MDDFEREAVMAELDQIREDLRRLEQQYGFVLAENVRLNRRLTHTLNVKRRMHERLDALYRKTKAERDESP